MLELAVPLAKDVLHKLATKATSSVLDKFEKEITGQGLVRTERGLTLFISNEDVNDIIKIVDSLEKSGLLIDGASETVKHEIKKQEGGFLPAMMAPMAVSLIAPMFFFINTTYNFFINKFYNWKRTRRWVSSIVSTAFNNEIIGKKS